MTGFAMFLLLAGWALVYVGFTSPAGDLGSEVRAAFGAAGSPAGRPPPSAARAKQPTGKLGP
jgi:hypothetical protein